MQIFVSQNRHFLYFRKSHSASKPLQTRNWYSRVWRKKDAECKVLENSVGLSFLQTYSDEEEEVDNEEIVICSSTKSNQQKEDSNLSLSDIKDLQDKMLNQKEFKSINNIEFKTKHKDNIIDEIKLKGINDINQYNELGETQINEDYRDDKEYTPEKELLMHKIAKDEEIFNTKSNVKKMEIDFTKAEESCKKDKLKHKQDLLDVECEDKTVKARKLKKKSKKKSQSSDSDSDDEKYENKKQKKKQKSNQKETSEEESSDDQKKLKKAKKKDKKKEKTKKKLKDNRLKTKEDISADDMKREIKKKKKDKEDTEEQTENKRRNKKKQIKKQRDESESASSSDESGDNKPLKKEEYNPKRIKNKKYMEKTIVDEDIETKDTAKTCNDVKDHRPGKERTFSDTVPNDKVIEYTDLRQKLVAKSTRMKDLKSQEKSSDIKNVNIKHIYQKLLQKNRKHPEDEFEDFPLEKDTYVNKKKEPATPDTEEYLGNWEKESDAVWESEEELPPKPSLKVTSSWESDEETFERRSRNVEIRSFKDSLDLEIPLNIKPFKRRSEHVLDNDTELQILKIEGHNLSEERRLLEIEKIKVKELELRVMREVEEKVSRYSSSNIFNDDKERTPPRDLQKMKKSTRNSDATKLEIYPQKSSKNIVIDLDKIQEKAKQEISKPKRDRWDQKIVASSTPLKNLVDLTGMTPEIVTDQDDVILITSSTEKEETSAVLENEYEQFMKAVSSDVSDKIDCINIDAHMTPTKPPLLSPKDVSFIPMPNEIKPVPVPSPRLETEKISISNPLINLSLSANITLDITSKIDSPSSKCVEILSSPSTSKTEAVVSSSSVDMKPDLLKTEHTSEMSSNLQSLTQLELPKVDLKFDPPIIIQPPRPKEEDDRSELKSFSFGGMTLPTKKILLDNSNLKLGDSDDEDLMKLNKMRPMDDFKKENVVDVIPPVSKIEQIEPKRVDEKKLSELISTEDSGAYSHKRRRSRSPDVSKHIEIKQPRKEGSPKRSSSNLNIHSSPPRSNRHESPGRRRRKNSPGRRRSPRRRSPCRRSLDIKLSPIRSRRSPGRRSPGRKSPNRRSPAGTYNLNIRYFLDFSLNFILFANYPIKIKKWWCC